MTIALVVFTTSLCLRSTPFEPSGMSCDLRFLIDGNSGARSIGMSRQAHGNETTRHLDRHEAQRASFIVVKFGRPRIIQVQAPMAGKGASNRNQPRAGRWHARYFFIRRSVLVFVAVKTNKSAPSFSSIKVVTHRKIISQHSVCSVCARPGKKKGRTLEGQSTNHTPLVQYSPRSSA